MGKKQLWIALGLVLFGAVMLFWPQDEDAEKRYFRNEGFVFGTTYSIQYEAEADLSVQIKGALDAVDTSVTLKKYILSLVKCRRLVAAHWILRLHHWSIFGDLA